MQNEDDAVTTIQRCQECLAQNASARPGSILCAVCDYADTRAFIRRCQRSHHRLEREQIPFAQADARWLRGWARRNRVSLYAAAKRG